MINDPHHILKTSQMICSVNQLIGLYAMGTPVVNGLISLNALNVLPKF